MEDNNELLTLTADIAAAYVSNNTVQASDVPSVIQTIYRALAGVGAAAAPMPEPQKPAVPIKKSITPDLLASRFKSDSPEHAQQRPRGVGRCNISILNPGKGRRSPQQANLVSAFSRKYILGGRRHQY